MGYAYVYGTLLAQGSRPPLWLAPPPFEVLVLTAREFQPASALFPEMEVRRIALVDDYDRGITPSEWASVVALSNVVVRYIRACRPVLTTCWEGRNRSGLVNALVMIRLGVPVEDTILRIRAARRHALTNPHFVARIRDFSQRYPYPA